MAARTDINVGDRVAIRDSRGLTGRVIEFCGPLGPDGVDVYRVLLRKKPQRAYIEVCEDQIEPLPPAHTDAPAS